MGLSFFSSDFLVMKIRAFDMILGVQWLKTLGLFFVDMAKKLFEFH